MKGTEKQIAWATEIRENVIKSLEFVKANSPAAVQAEVQNRIDRMSKNDIYAGAIIELFKGVQFGDDEMNNAKEVMFIYTRRGYVPMHQDEKRLLCM